MSSTKATPTGGRQSQVAAGRRGSSRGPVTPDGTNFARVSAEESFRTGLPVALASAAAFGLTGSFADSLLEIGWSPAAAVIIRLTITFSVLLVPAALILWRTRLPNRRELRAMVTYGLVPMAGAQLCYFNAVQYLSVGVALLMEYLGPVLLIGWLWLRRGQQPTIAKLVGAALALIGLGLVLDLTNGLKLSPIGLLWGFGAAVCLCAYFVMSENTSTGSPLVLTTVGAGVAATALTLATGLGLLNFVITSNTATLAGHSVPWWVPALALGLISGAFSYVTGIEAVRRLGSSVASFVALTEVVFAVAFAALLVGQIPTFTQIIGGIVILIGIAVVQAGPRSHRAKWSTN